ncbi:MAG TPA: hypothetical protein VHP12_00875, partial [Chitinophagaceae bacterium]|nr:hypothetical protein [Chitinophagaceae bacterium]
MNTKFKGVFFSRILFSVATIFYCPLFFTNSIFAQQVINIKANQPAVAIQPAIWGIFFEDINYAADGGLYAELIQNRSFEYTPTDKISWNCLTAWEYITPGYAYGKIDIETNAPINSNNPHYVVLNVEETNQDGVGLKNTGFGGIPVKA